MMKMPTGFCWGTERSETGIAKDEVLHIDLRAVCAEMLAMTLFVIIGCGTACGNGAGDGETRMVVAMAFGMGILVLAYTFGKYSGGQINCAVTLSLVLGGKVPWYQGLSNLLGQLLGSVLGALILCIIFPCHRDMTLSLGSNVVGNNYEHHQALVGEIFGTYILCIVVWETAVSPNSTVGQNACIAIGFAVFLAHVLLLPIDGCSINPTRSFGPAIVGAIRTGVTDDCDGYDSEGMKDLWVMFVGPLIGASLATLTYYGFMFKELKCNSSDEMKEQAKPLKEAAAVPGAFGGPAPIAPISDKTDQISPDQIPPPGDNQTPAGEKE
jgi:MIP family channel proteins